MKRVLLPMMRILFPMILVMGLGMGTRFLCEVLGYQITSEVLEATVFLQIWRYRLFTWYLVSL